MANAERAGVPRTLKLYYFNARGRAEHVRQLLALAGAPFENVVVDADSWPSVKEDMPLGQVPVLEVNGVKIGQSLAIARYIGFEYGFTAATHLENARLDMIADLIGEAWSQPFLSDWNSVLLGETIIEDKSEYFKTNVRPRLEHYANVFEKFLVENGSTALLCGDEVTWVDVFAAEFFSRFQDFGESDCLEAYPHIQNLIARIHNIPAIRKHIESRAATIL